MRTGSEANSVGPSLVVVEVKDLDEDEVVVAIVTSFAC